MKRYFSITCVVLCLVLSATAKDKKQKGPVTVSIQASVERVKSALVSRTLAQGFSIDSDTQFQIVLSKEITGGRGILAQMLTGNSYSDPPRYVGYFTFVPNGDMVMLTGRQETATRMAYGQVNRVSLDGGKARKGMVDLLEAVKAEAEAPPPNNVKP